MGLRGSGLMVCRLALHEAVESVLQHEEVLAKRLSHDSVRADIQRQWNRSSPVLRIGGVTNEWVLEYLRSFDQMNTPGYYAAIKVPVLLGSASEDALTRPDVQERACSAMANCNLIRLENAWHELFMESEPIRSRWLKAVFEFLKTYSTS